MALVQGGGDKLFRLLNDLGITMGKTDRTVIDGWYDTNCQSTLDFLNWICHSIDGNNVLSSQENDAYETLLDNDLLLSNEKYDSALAELEMNYTDVFDVRGNQFEIECLNDEIAICESDLEDLQESTSNAEKLSNVLNRSMAKKRTEQVAAEVKEAVARDKCMELSNKLQDLNKQLEAQILKCGEHLNNFDVESNPTFISSIPNDDFNAHCSDVVTVINRVLGKHQAASSNADLLLLSSNKNKLQQSLFNNTAAASVLEELQNRIANSIFKYVRTKSEKDALESTLNYLNELDLFEASSCILQGMDLYLTESLIISKREQVKILTSDLEVLAGQTSKKYINLPKLTIAQMDLKQMQEKNIYFTQLNAKIDDILAYQFLTFMFYERENKNMEITDGFFRDVYQYISYDLQKCKSRTEMMKRVIEDFSGHKSKPLVQQYKVLRDAMALHGGDAADCGLQEVVDAVEGFRGECKRLAKKVYLEDVNQFKADCETAEENVDVMKRFLVSGPTSQNISIPYNLHVTFNKVDKVLEQQANVIKSTTLLTNGTEKKLSKNKWLNIRRQLWMYYLIAPKKVLGFIEHIENELKTVTRTQLGSK